MSELILRTAPRVDAVAAISCKRAPRPADGDATGAGRISHAFRLTTQRVRKPRDTQFEKPLLARRTGTPRRARNGHGSQGHERARSAASADRHDSPGDILRGEDLWEDAFCTSSRQQHLRLEKGRRGCSFHVHHVQQRVALLHRNHRGNEFARVRQLDVLGKTQQRPDRRGLLARLEQCERPRELTGATDDRRATRAVVPVARGREPAAWEADPLTDEPSNEEPIVDQRPTGRQGPGRSTPRPQPRSARRGRACPEARPELSQYHQGARAPRRRGRRTRSHHRPRCPTGAGDSPAGSPALDATLAPS